MAFCLMHLVFPLLCEQTAKALAWLRGNAGSPEPSLSPMSLVPFFMRWLKFPGPLV